MRFADHDPLQSGEMEVHVSSYKPNGKFYCSATLRDRAIEMNTPEWFRWLATAVPDLGRGACYVVTYTTLSHRSMSVVEYDHSIIFDENKPEIPENRDNWRTTAHASDEPDMYAIIFYR